ncbi:hypothetical protein STRIP9103_09555 [Streptomyces ipomoeae 91-03]|uniref:Uncharacterized protein n=1 Tax=Streptomyces ipomoeae 91-03 TaxID=698759 RepID=L1KVU6_9ACTN|nr:hypothetical protein STRIP9103_09555 [Streptomyces ipomoeae 91-03]
MPDCQCMRSTAPPFGDDPAALVGGEQFLNVQTRLLGPAALS